MGLALLGLIPSMTGPHKNSPNMHNSTHGIRPIQTVQLERYWSAGEKVQLLILSRYVFSPGVQPLSMVDNSTFSPIRLTVPSEAH